MSNKSHHKNQPPAFCHCGRCLGVVKQKPRTIEDHRSRYPRELATVPESQINVLNALDTVDEQPAEEVDYPIDDEQQAAEAQDCYAPRLGLDVEQHLELEPIVPSMSHTPSPISDTNLSPPRLSSPQDEIDMLDDIEGDEPLEVPPETEHVYAFDNLLEQLPGPRDFLQPPAGRPEYNEGNENYDAQFDPDFGLPVRENEQYNNNVQYVFDFNDDLQDAEDNNETEDEIETTQHSAFREPDLIRNAYIDAFVQKHLYGATHRALKHQLKASKRSISAHPDIHIEHTSRMAQTITTAEKRLGLDTDGIITVFVLCPICRRRYSQDYIAQTDSALCLNEDCSGVLFTLRKLASGKTRRVAHMTYPFALPIAWIKHMLSLPGMAELMQHWQNDRDDKDRLKSLVTSEDWMENLDPHKPMGDLCNGFQTTKEGNYSVGACYLVIDNLPRHMRFLRENISLSILMPGPHEPDDYALDQMLSPLIEELLELKQGVRMVVRQGHPPILREEIVHANLNQHIADLMACIKMGGGAGLKSELNFCLYCHMRLSSLSVPAGYNRRVFDYRDPKEELRNAYIWRGLQTLEQRKALFEQTGN
ncbi:Transposase family tnp2 [Ceratobasidium sp. AG-Ba]|nr:Transposase family tnp2 [Ceratobasidium sp. AG-Ba]